ncbi:MAG: sigma-54-dependent transcriptional regulator [Pseudobdellovibrionaceae bacterium]
MTQNRVLIVDDESTHRTTLFRHFERWGYKAITAAKLEEARAWINTDKGFDVAVIDQTLPDGAGSELFSLLKMQNPQVEIILLTDTADNSPAQDHLYILKRPVDINHLQLLCEKFLAAKSLGGKTIPQQRQDISRRQKFDLIVGQSEPIQNVLNLIDKVADSDSTILIHGASGTGKELIAKAIHMKSHRRTGPFIPINCGAIPSELLESELFGHIKGAFTGAISNRAGRFELADGGTLFLDEIGDLKPSLQVKILRALQERCFEAVGGTKTIQVDVRVIAATNVNLEEAVSTGQFREDLFYRLNVIPINVPSLTERRQDIPLLLNHFMQIFNKNKNKNILGILPEALESLVRYEWPGNIRELENLVERMTILKGEGWIDLSDLPIKYKQHKAEEFEFAMTDIPDNGMDFNSAVDAYENALILKALERTGWNRNQAAALLRLNRTTLVEKIKKKGLIPPAGDKEI